MKNYFVPAILFMMLMMLDLHVNAQHGRYRGRYPMHHRHHRTMVSIGIGGGFGGYWGYPMWRRPYWGPGIGVGVGVMVPPPGSRLRGLPPGAEERVYNDITYYYRNNTYYRERKEGGFEVVEPPMGAELDRLPQGAKLRKTEGKYYYERDGVFYSMIKDENGRSRYVVVGKNGELDTEGSYSDMNGYEEDENQRYNDDEYDEEDMPIVKNGNEADDGGEAASVRPEIGDRFEELPANTRAVTVDGKKQYVSPQGTYYKEVVENGQTVYEVVRSR